jgi:hypothetical protein
MANKNRSAGTDVVGKRVQDIQRSQSLKSAQGSASGGAFQRALVAEVITDPEILVEFLEKEEKENPFKGKIKNEELARAMPRGALLVKKVTEKGSSEFDIAIPMMSSHLMMPAKVGEQVWVFEDGGEYLYWFGRVGASGMVEDVNFTHKDREFETPTKPATDAKSKADAAKGVSSKTIPRFNDGVAGGIGGTKNSPKGMDSSSLKGNSKLTSFCKDSVPRFTPRPGDLTLQGSNNTLISLGTDRGWTKSDSDFSQSNADLEAKAGTGTIDIVAGRGAAQDSQKPTDEKSDGDAPSRTGSRLIKDADGGVETDKIAKLNGQAVNRSEGDPDFYQDASRVYVSMNSPIDSNFSLSDEYISLFEGSAEDKEAASVALKSNEIRIIAREDGSIRIIKEKGDGGSPAQIILNSDGVIHIQGAKIYLGEDLGNEPYVKYSELESYLNDVHGALNGFCATLMGHAITWFGPNPQIVSAATALQSELNIYKAGIQKFPSDKIFGE